MHTKTYQQEEVRNQLIKYLTESKKSIQLSIGWIGDNGLVGLLQKKALEGLAVTLVLIKEENDKQGAEKRKELSHKGVNIIELDGSYKEQLIDHKFGILDDSVVLTGSYAWGAKNAPKEFSLTISVEIPTLALGFQKEFDYLMMVNELSKETSKPTNPITALLKNLEILKSAIDIGALEDLDPKMQAVETFVEDKNIATVFYKLDQEAYEEAADLIRVFIKNHEYLQECIDPPIENFQREIKLLEEEITTISNEYSETQKTLDKFSKVHTESLGDLLQKILFQTKLKAEIEAKQDEEKQAAFEEAEKDHEEYTKSHEQAKKQQLKILTPEEQKELKKLYRQNSLKCHPDRVVDELHDQAEEIFVELNQAYKANDLERIREINRQLKAGIMLSKSEGITTLKKLESTLKSLMKKREDWLDKLNELQEMPSYKTINRIDDWEAYFEETKIVLQDQLGRLLEFNQSVI